MGLAGATGSQGECFWEKGLWLFLIYSNVSEAPEGISLENSKSALKANVGSQGRNTGWGEVIVEVGLVLHSRRYLGTRVRGADGDNQ